MKCPECGAPVREEGTHLDLSPKIVYDPEAADNRCPSIMQASRSRQVRCELPKGHEGNHCNRQVSTVCEFQW